MELPDEEWNPENPSEYTACKYIRSRGYVEARNGFWTKPSSDHIVTREESDAIWYLVLEWDFGGLDG